MGNECMLQRVKNPFAIFPFYVIYGIMSPNIVLCLNRNVSYHDWEVRDHYDNAGAKGL